MPKISGYLLIATGIIHNAIGVLIGHQQLRDIALGGFFNTVDSDIYRQAIFWFLFSGFLMILIGQLFLSMKIHIPAAIGWHLLVLCVAGAIMMPVSGFWLVIPQASYIIISSNRTKRHEAAQTPLSPLRQ